jgi:DNA-binding LytR/AlgR family response regulator
MNAIKCLIVDDEPVARQIIESYVAKLQNIELVASCKNVSEAFEVLNSNSIDIVFLDINMPDVSGLTLARSISKETKVIFTTAYREFAVEGFDLQAVDYLLKPISFDRFLKAVQKYFDLYPANKTETTVQSEKQYEDSFFVRSDRKMVKVELNAIHYIESLGDYVKIHLGESSVVTRETMSNIESKLPENRFLRTHRSFIVAMNSITGYTNEYIELSKKAIPISRSYKETVFRILEK